METRCTRIKLKPGVLGRVREWQAELNRRKEEALATLRDETVVLECFWLEHAEDGDYLICVMAAESFEQSKRVVKTSPHPVDEYHQQFKRDAWESGRRLELLLELNRIAEPRGATP